MTIYGKLVRDNVPDQLRAKGTTFRIRSRYVEPRVGLDEFIAELAKKLVEEAKETRQSLSVEELADLLETIHALMEAFDLPFSFLEEVREAKASIRGRFRDRVLLLEATDRDDD